MAKKKVKFQRFEGFPRKGLSFLKDLKTNNDRDWFKEHKATYDDFVKAPLTAFVDDCDGRFGRGKMFRIHRDVRFSKNKDPYKTHASVVFEEEGLVYYWHIEPGEHFAATGMHMMAKDQLQRFYAAIDEEKSGKKIVKLVEAAEEAGLSIGGEALKTVARGYPKDHPRVRLLRHKGLTVSRNFKGVRWMHDQSAGETVTDAWAEGDAINAWLKKHVGPSEEGSRWVKR